MFRNKSLFVPVWWNYALLRSNWCRNTWNSSSNALASAWSSLTSSTIFSPICLWEESISIWNRLTLYSTFSFNSLTFLWISSIPRLSSLALIQKLKELSIFIDLYYIWKQLRLIQINIKKKRMKTTLIITSNLCVANTYLLGAIWKPETIAKRGSARG